MYIDWLKQNQDYIAIDIETDDLDATKIWCLAYENIRTKEKGLLTTYEDISDFFASTKPRSRYVGHNILKFDAPVLNRLLGVNIPLDDCIDTLTLSTLYNPSLQGGHSLDAWGERLRMAKGDFSDFSAYTPEMGAYCQQDVSITAELFRKITKVLAKIGFSDLTCEIQHKFTAILEQQRRNGFYFDGPRAVSLYQELRSIEEELKEQVRHVFPARKSLVRRGRVYTKDGRLRAQYQKDCSNYEVRRDGEDYEAFEYIEFNLGSPDQRVEKLTALGWVNDPDNPDEVTKTGKPRPFHKNDLVPSLQKFVEENPTPEIAMIAKWMAINGRANMINTWLDAWNEETGCIHGNLFVADTLRLRHQSPNTANIPAVRASKSGELLRGLEGYFTYESRDLWVARPGRVLVGTDAAGLELRMLAHFLNRPDFTAQVLDGDPHQFNADLAGVSRPVAKTLLYAIQYGAQAKKVGSIIGRSAKEGGELRETFLERLGIKGVMDDAISEQQSGRVWLVDGAGVVCPSPHSALNYKLQGSGARVMAMGAIILDGYIRSDGLDSLKVGDIHDEWQYDVHPDDARQHARRSVQAIREAGEYLNLNIPLDGTAKEGLTWAETH